MQPAKNWGAKNVPSAFDSAQDWCMPANKCASSRAHGLPGWADTTPAIEQLAVGHRDNILPLDDAAEGESRELKMEDKFRQVAYAIARNRPRNVDKKHMKNSNLIVRDYRIIVLSSSELALGTIASNAGKPRKGGERVRLIDVPAFPGSHGIFDGELHGNTSIAETAKLVDPTTTVSS
jgi:hypothetical protein